MALEMTEALVYKLMMIGAKVADTLVYPESILKKKCLSIAYHRIREAVAIRSILIYFEKGVSNLAGLFTKLSVSKEQGYSGQNIGIVCNR